jgi:hypothetical protein
VTRAAALAALLALAAAPAARAQEEGAGTGYPAGLRMGGLSLYKDTQAPMSLVTLPAKPAGAEDAGEVKASRCQRGLALPIAANLRATSVSGAKGKGGFDQALEQIMKEHPDLKGIYDVRVDLRSFSVLGFFRKLCVEVTARGYR